MEETKYRINLDVQQGGVQQTLMGFRIGDALSRTVCIHLVERGAAYQVPAGCVVTLYAQKPDGTVSYSLCSVEDGAVEHTFTSGELAAAGEVLCEVRITTGGETPVVLSSPQFSLIVEDVLQDDDAIASTNEYSALTQAIAELEEVSEAAEEAAQSANTAAGAASSAADSANAAAQAANSAAEGIQEALTGKTTSYVLQWTDAQYEEYEAVMAQNKLVLETLYAAEEGSYHVVLKNGDKEFTMSRREQTSSGRYEFCFPSEISSGFAPYEYVVWYEPGNNLDPAECGLSSRYVVNNENIVEYDFRPPTTDLVRACMDQHETNTTVHITAAERAKWNAGTGSGDGVTSYVLQWSDQQYEDYREENEPILQALCTAEEGSYYLVLKNGDKVFPMSRKTYTEQNGYTYYFPSDLTEMVTEFEYQIRYKPAEGDTPAEYSAKHEYIVNNEEMAEYDFRPPTTDLVRLCMDQHENDTDIHITSAERSKWDAGSVTYTLSKTGSTIKLAGSDGTEQTVTDSNTTYGSATTSTAGLMSAADKAKLDGITESADSVAFTPALTSGTGVGTLTINGTETTLWAPMNTHYVSETVVTNSATSQADAAAANGNVYLNHIENSEVKSSHKLTGSGATTVTSDSSGNITIQSTNTTYGTATTSAAGLMSAADKAKLDGAADAASLNSHTSDTTVHITAEERAKWNAGTGSGDGVTSYVLQWTDAQYEEYEAVMAQNKSVLETLYAAEEGSYHVVLKNGDKEFTMSRREHTSSGRYEFCFPSEITSGFAPYEYVVWYEPAAGSDAAECGLSSRYVVNNENIVEYDFRPPTTDLVRLCMDQHENDTNIHITSAERSKWDAGSVTYTLSKTGSTIKLTGSDGSEQTVTDSTVTYGDATPTVRGLMSAADKAKLDGIAEGANNYAHPTYTSKTSGLYKITVNGQGHVSAATAVTKSDITPLLDMDAIIAAFPDASEVNY